MPEPDSLKTLFCPVDLAFPGSILEMPVDADACAVAATSPWWWQALIIVSIVLILLNVPNLRFIGIRLLDCSWRWRGNYILEASIPNQQARNMLTATLLLPFFLIIYRFQIADPMWVGAYFLVRILFQTSLLWSVGNRRSDYKLSGICIANYFILLVVLMLSTLAILKLVFNASDSAIRVIFWIETAVLYLLHFVRKTEILMSAFPSLRVFLYLCALEIVPAGLFVVASVLL